MEYLIKKEYDYGVRICAFLAGQPKYKPIPVSHISRKMNLSKPIATKIVYKLVKSGVLKSVQGKYGGIFLFKDAKTTSVFEIMLALGFNAALNDCLIEGHNCPLSSSCKIQNFFAEQETILYNNFKQKMIADLIFDIK